MLESKRGFSVIQFIIVMTVTGLLLMGLGIWVAQRAWRDNQRRTDLTQVVGMVERYAANHQGKYPDTKDADNPSSALRGQFDQLGLRDPRTDKYYVLGSKWDDCDPTAQEANMGTGYIGYARPGTNSPFKVRICLEWGDYSIGD